MRSCDRRTTRGWRRSKRRSPSRRKRRRATSTSARQETTWRSSRWMSCAGSGTCWVHSPTRSRWRRPTQSTCKPKPKKRRPWRSKPVSCRSGPTAGWAACGSSALDTKKEDIMWGSMQVQALVGPTTDPIAPVWEQFANAQAFWFPVLFDYAQKVFLSLALVEVGLGALLWMTQGRDAEQISGGLLRKIIWIGFMYAVLLVAAFGVLFAFLLIALQLLFTLIESYIVTGAGVFLLGFAAFRGTATISERYLGYVVAVG